MKTATENRSGKVLVYDFQVSVLVPFHLFALSGFVWGAFSAIVAAMVVPVSETVDVSSNSDIFSSKRKHGADLILKLLQPLLFVFIYNLRFRFVQR